MGHLQLFDYQAIERGLASRLQERAERISRRESRIVEDILANGKEFAEAREELRHDKAGGFAGWVAFHGWNRRTVYNYIQAWEQFGNCANFAQLGFDASAVYVLSAPSTPPAARAEAMQLAEAGGTVTHARAKEMVERHQPADEGEDEGLPRDTISLLTLKALEREAADNGEYESAAEYRQEAGELAAELMAEEEARPPAEKLLIVPAPPPRHPHSDRLKNWLLKLQSETLVIRVEMGGIGKLLAEPEKWNRRDVTEFVLPMLRALAPVVAQFTEEIEHAFE